MADANRPFALFRVAAGARMGYGHLRRASVLARALRRPCALSLRGAAQVPSGWTPAPASPRAALALRPRLLVLDDPRADAAMPWVRAARRLAIPCASLHDLGLAELPTDLAIDGSLRRASLRLARARLVGPAYAVIDVRGRVPVPRASARPRILVSFGGGTHPRLVRATVDAIRAAVPSAHLLLPRGFAATAPVGGRGDDGALTVVTAPHGLAPWLRGADLAIVAGGLTLYEAAALGVPTLAVAVVPAQRPTIAAFARVGAAIRVVDDRDVRRVASRLGTTVRRLWADPVARARMAAAGRASVDGRGPARVAAALRRLTEDVRG